MKNRKRLDACCLAFVFLFASADYGGQAPSKAEAGWPNYGNDPGGTRYSSASQIDRTNVARLKVAWTYRTGANDTPTRLIKKAAFEATPILLNGVLFFSTPYNQVIALNAESGARLWEYDPQVNLQRNYS